MDDDLKFLLLHLQDAVAASWDGIILVDGLEGSGKSGLALTIAYELDPTFNVSRVVFTPEQFFKAIDSSVPCQAIVWDEFITGGMSAEAITKVQREITRLMVMIRKKHLYIILVLPYFFMTSRYFAVARSRFLLHTYTPDGISRGRWMCWNYDRKRQMYFRGRKEFDYCVKPYKSGRFGDFFKLGVINKDEYEKKKDAAMKEILEGKKEEPKKEEEPKSETIIDPYFIEEEKRTIEKWRNEQHERKKVIQVLHEQDQWEELPSTLARERTMRESWNT